MTLKTNTKSLGAIRALKLFVVFGMPLLGALYFFQFLNSSRDIQVPFKPFRVLPGEILSLEGRTPLQLKDSVTLVHFWATWCAPCLEEFPSLLELRRQIGSKGLRLVFVSVDEKPEVVKAFVDQNRFSIGVDDLFWDPSREIASKWGTEKFPETYVLRPDGWVVEKVVGGQTWIRPPVIKYFESLIGKFKDLTTGINTR
jgi:thiol-disulfide isomerase/thioredoxin